MSPTSRKKTGRAYVALARAHSEKYVYPAHRGMHAKSTLTCRGDLQVALELYRKAETYVPDNIKLRERWILFVVDVFLCKLSMSGTQF